MTETSSKSGSSSGRLRVYFEPGGEIDTVWDRIIFWTLAGLILALPLCFGVPPNVAWAEALFIAGAATMGLAYAMKLITHRDQQIRWTWAYLPIALFLLLCLFQIIPLPASLVRVISGATLNVRSDLMHDLPNSAEKLQSLPLTFYMENSLRQLRLVFALSVVFVVTLNVFRRLDQIKQLLLVVAGVGAVMGIIALLQDLTHTKKILWTFEPKDDPLYVAHAGPYRNHSHFSQLMNLSIGAALALALLSYKQTIRGAFTSMKDRLASRDFQLLLAAIGAIGLCALAILFSTSRSGILALGGAGLLATAMTAYKQRVHAVRAFAAVAAIVIVIVALVLSVEKVRQSFINLSGDNQSVSVRMAIFRALPAQWRQYPVFGTGLGSFEVVFPMFDHPRHGRQATHAEDEYVQLMTETGAIGVLAALAFIVVVGASYVRVLRKGSSDAASVAIGLGFGVLAILIQSALDFGQHLVANAMLMAVTCGLLLNLRQIHRRAAEVREEAQATRQGNVPLRAIGGCVVVVAFALALWGGIRTSIAQYHWKKATEVETLARLRGWKLDKRMFDDLLGHSGAAVQFAPRNVIYRNWNNVYHWYAGSADLPRKADGSLADGEPLTKFTLPLIADLNDARWLCPTYAANYAQLGQYETFILDMPIGTKHVRTAFRLSPNDPSILYIAGQLEGYDGDPNRSAELLNLAMMLDPNLITGVLQFYLYEMKKPELALAAARGNIIAMQTFAIQLERQKQYPDMLATVERELREAYLVEAAKPKPDPNFIAWAAESERKAKNTANAIELYRRALAARYDAIGWRMALARLLAETGDADGAKREAQICLRLQPHMPEAESFIAQLSANPRQ